MRKNFFSFLDNLKKKNTQDKDKNIVKNDEKESNILNTFNHINQGADNLLNLAEPKLCSVDEETNIACKFKENFILTRDGNLSMGIELKGVSYSAIELDEELSRLSARVNFFTRLHPQIELNIIVKKDKVADVSHLPLESENVYANEITSKWQKSQNIYRLRYFLMISTINKNITGFLESIKEKSSEDTKAQKSEANLRIKLNILNETFNDIKTRLGSYKPRLMHNDEVINFYASYANASETKLKYNYELLSDSYMSSDLEFKKSHFIFNTNEGKEIFARFISIKAYESDTIKSLISSNIVKNDNEFLVFAHIQPYAKEKAIKKIKETRVFSQEIIKEELDTLMELVKADKENLLKVSYSMLLKDENLEKLELKTQEIMSILKNQNLNVVRESINQKALFFSFFPSRGNLNARKKTLKVSNVATIMNFENEVTGFNRNDWGEEAVTQFKHLNGTPFLFNFHFQEFGDKPNGHTLIIGGTGAGKTTLTQFLMTNLFKYKIDIFAMDKLRGMFNFTQYMNGEYHDSDSKEFKLNPFSLLNNPSAENVSFLEEWLEMAAGLKEEEHEARNDIKSTLKRLRMGKKEEQTLSFENFLTSLTESNKESNLKIRFENYRNSIFNNIEDALNFNKQLSVLNMDSILNNPKIAGLSAMYIFHKLKNSAKNNESKRGFFCFIDELKDYLSDELMGKKILEAILEVRKIGGIMCMGYQTITLFKQQNYASSFLNNIANFIIFPTSNTKELEALEELIGLTPAEAKFLATTSMEARQVLDKMRLRNESAYLDVDLSKLGSHLKVYSSSSDNVMLMKRLKEQYPNEWRSHYLRQSNERDELKELKEELEKEKKEKKEQVKQDISTKEEEE